MKALIIDDEPMPAKHLQQMIKEHGFEISSTDIQNSPVKALQEIKESHYDIIFLDVEMPQMSGFEFLENASIEKDTAVIFTTAYSEYAVQAFKANASYYILKPVMKEELITAIRKASALLRMSTKAGNILEKISVFEGEEYHVLKTVDIIRFEADGSYTKVVTNDKNHLSSKRLGYYSDDLERAQFLRCHHSHLINLDQVNRIGKGKNSYVVMNNGDTIPVSSSKRSELQKALNL